MASSSPLRQSPRPLSVAWLDVLAIALWGILMLHYWVSGRLNLLIHPAYRWLTVACGFSLLVIALARVFNLLQQRRSRSARAPNSAQHLASLPRVWSAGLLIVVGILGFVLPLRAFASEIATQRGLSEFMTLTRAQPQHFRVAIAPEKRSIIDWVRTLNVYPEPDAYIGQKVKVQGFVVHPEELNDSYFLISRFVITCCAADVYPVGIPVKLTTSRSQYKPDSWLEVEGRMTTELLQNNRKLTILPEKLTPIPEPANPYSS